MFTITIESTFRATHQLALEGGTREPLHEHQWHVTAAVQAKELDEMGTVMDFHELERLLGEIIDLMADQQLETTDLFDGRNVSAEAVAQFIYDMLSPKMPPERIVAWVEVTESPGCKARYSIG